MTIQNTVGHFALIYQNQPCPNQKKELSAGKSVSDTHQKAAASFTSSSRPTAGFVIGGPAWPKRTLYYYAPMKGQYIRGVQTAVDEWNARKMGVTLRKTNNRARADFTIMVDPHTSLGGFATVGYFRGYNWVKLNMPGRAWPDIAWVASHELGHIFGLGHSTGCAVMSYAAYTACKWPDREPWNYRCRLQEPDDLKGIYRLYHHSYNVRPDLFCLRNPAANPVTGLTAVPGDRTFIASLSWAASARAKQYYIQRSAVNGACAQKPTDYQAVTALTYKDIPQAALGLTAAGNYCYSVWSVNLDGYAAGLATFSVSYQPPLPAPVTNLVGVNLNDGWSNFISLSWTNAVGTNYIRMFRSDLNGPCITVMTDYSHETYPSGLQTAADYPPTGAGNYCYTVFASDDNGKTYSVAATTVVAFAG